MNSIGKHEAMATNLKFATILIALSFLSGCQDFYMKPGTAYGEIKIGKPRITTRERLVNDRLEEEAWLKKQLDKTDDQDFFDGYQGYSDVRSFTGISANAGGNYDPGQMTIYKEQQNQQLQDLNRQAALKEKDYQIALAKKQSQLDAANKDATQAGGTIYDTTSLTSSASSPASAPVATATLDAMNNKLDTLGTKLNTLMPAQDSISTTKTKPSPIDQFRDKLAYREEIRNEILQNALDDSHDLQNNTLYRLNFDTTVIPTAEDTSAWAMVEVKVSSSANPEPTSEEFATIINNKLSEERHKVVDAISKVITEVDACKKLEEITITDPAITHDLAACLNDNKFERIALYFPPLYSPPIEGSAARNRILSPRVFSLLPGQTIPKENPPSDNAQAVVQYGRKICNKCSLPILIGNFVSEYLARLQLYQPEKISFDANTGNFSPAAETATGRLKGFEYNNETYGIQVRDKNEAETTTFMELYDVPELERGNLDLNKKAEIRAEHISFLGATPKESVQRISDVLARRQATELGLALSAVTGMASMNTALSYINQNDGLFHALRRQPLVVGYTDIDSFGWLIGPKYEIRKQGNGLQVGYRHVPIQNGVSGIISVPVFWKSVKLSFNKYWQPENGKHRKVADFSGKDYSADEVHATTVNLPARFLLAYDLFKNNQGGRNPNLDDLAQANTAYTVTDGKSASITILGENLWRSATVLMGGQSADKVTVLPNMKGIVAHFEEVEYPGFVKDSDQQVDLLVVTAEGSIRAGKVTILKAAKKKAEVAKWEIAGNPIIYPKAALALKPSPNTDGGYSKVTLELSTISKPKNGVIVGTLSTEKDGGVTFDSKNFVATIPDKFGGDKIVTGTEYQLRVRIDKIPDDANPIAQTIGNVVYFKDADSTKASAQKQSDTKVVITFPKAYQAAYPAMKGKPKFKVQIKYKYDDSGVDTEKEEHDLDCAISSATSQCTVYTIKKIKTLSDAAIEDGSDRYPKIIIK